MARFHTFSQDRFTWDILEVSVLRHSADTREDGVCGSYGVQGPCYLCGPPHGGYETKKDQLLLGLMNRIDKALADDSEQVSAAWYMTQEDFDNAN